MCRHHHHDRRLHKGRYLKDNAPAPTKRPNELITRRSIFIVSFQLEGIGTALRVSLQCRAEPGAATIVLLMKLQSDFRRLIASGRVVNDVPEISEGMSAPELLAIAEVPRTSAMSFLSPDEAEQRQRSIGFSPAAERGRESERATLPTALTLSARPLVCPAMANSKSGSSLGVPWL